MPLTAPIANTLSSFCLEAGTVLDEMALCREGSPDPKLLDLGRGPILGPDAISPHGAGVRSGGKAAKVSPLRSASGVGATEGILVPPSSNRDGRPRAQRGTERRFSVLRALRWVYFLYCYVQLLFVFIPHLPWFPRLPSRRGLPDAGEVPRPRPCTPRPREHQKRPPLGPPATCSRRIRQRSPPEGMKKQTQTGVPPNAEA